MDTTSPLTTAGQEAAEVRKRLAKHLSSLSTDSKLNAVLTCEQQSSVQGFCIIDNGCHDIPQADAA